MSESQPESLGEFKDSFSYGSRNDLSFKFLKRLSPDEAGEFFSELLLAVGDTFDTASATELIDLVYRWQVEAYDPSRSAAQEYVYGDRPFTPLRRPLADSTIGVITSSGHYDVADPPQWLGRESMTQREAENLIQEFLKATPELTPVPFVTPDEELAVLHPGYDIRSAERDPEVALPRHALASMLEKGRLGSIAERFYTFIGATAQGRLRKVLPSWLDQLHGDATDVLLLVPV